MYSNLQILPPKETMQAWQNRPQQLVAKFIKKSLYPDDGNRSRVKVPSFNTPGSYEDEVNGGNGGIQNVRSGSPMTRISERFRSDSLNLF